MSRFSTYDPAHDMTTKLTLSVDESVATLAKRVAKARNTSVSAMFSRFVAGLDAAMDKAKDKATDKATNAPPIAPLTLAATGLARCLSAPDSRLATGARNDEALLEDALWDRYGPH